MQMEERVTVGVTQGDLRGRKTVTALGTTYYSFKGIPYAKPPLGALRFRVSTQRNTQELTRVRSRSLAMLATCLKLLYCLPHPLTLIMEAPCSSEMSFDFQRITEHYISEI
jgi:hypothetical protein